MKAWCQATESAGQEPVVNRHAVANGQAIGLVGQTDNGQQFTELLLCHALGFGTRSVGGNAVATIVGDAHGHVDEFLGERIQRAVAHHLLDVAPDALQGLGVMRQDFPEIVYPVRLAAGHDFVMTALSAGDAWSYSMGVCSAMLDCLIGDRVQPLPSIGVQLLQVYESSISNLS